MPTQCHILCCREALTFSQEHIPESVQSMQKAGFCSLLVVLTSALSSSSLFIAFC